MKKISFLAAVFLLYGQAGTFAQQNSMGNGQLSDLTIVKPYSKSMRISSANPKRSSNADCIPLKGGETKILADIEGQGFINHIWMTIPKPGWFGNNPDHGDLVLRIYWDGASQPSVEAPLGDFFASGFGKRRPVNSVPVFVEGGDAYNCFWVMPFYRSARIELENQSDLVLQSLYFHIDYSLEELPANTPYFCAQYRQEFPVRTDEDYLILDAEGMGHYVGMVMSCRSRSPEWFGEGDEKFYVDGATAPTIQGTGTEDYILHAWGTFSEMTYPYCGVSQIEGERGMVGWRITYYRWHVLDPIRFTKSLRVTIEDVGSMSEDEVAEGVRRGYVDRNDDFASVAFWYQLGQPKVFASLPSAKERELPNLDIIVDGETLLSTCQHSDGEVKLEPGYDWTGNGQLVFIPEENMENGAYLSCQFIVEKKDMRQATLRLTRSINYGAYRILLDGKEVRKNYDFYSPSTKVDEINLGFYELTPGLHTLRFEYIGRAVLSSGAGLGIDSFRLRQRTGQKRQAPKDFPLKKSH